VIVRPSDVASVLAEHHYLGPCKRGQLAYEDEHGAMVLARPASRSLPKDWLELSRWCLLRRERNAGSTQWARLRRHLIEERPDVSTVISYSDPSVGHDGALYRACGWVWAPVWHRLRPPPSGAGTWDGVKRQAVKDRWVCCLRPDERRIHVLTPNDTSIMRKYPWLAWCEPRTKRGICIPNDGGCDRARWLRDVGAL
jgi:hypothetical protein